MTLKNRIKDLEEQLKEAQQHTYVDETHTIHCSDGELNIGYGDYEEQKSLIINVESLFKDLPFIVNQVVKENNKMQQMHLECLKTSLKKL
tara:strand:+ start:239 stop:508 length:270 start_codon:yes stop_codon:yes gene_type:complete